MSADEQLWRSGIELLGDAAVVVARIAADVLQKYINILALETQNLWIAYSQVTAVAVSAYGPEDGLHSLEPVGKFCGTNVASMPNLVYIAKIGLIFIIPIAVGV